MSGATSRVSLVTLENAAERDLTTAELMLIVDNAKGIKYDHATDSYSLTGEDFGVARHFGGTVAPHGDDAVKVTVYID
jgi:hypothetical protein